MTNYGTTVDSSLKTGASKLSDWDIDFRRGEVGENLLRDVVETSEVKTDYRWNETYNVYVEYACYYRKEKEFRPSGISVSKAKYYSFVLPKNNQEPLIFSVPTETLKKALKKYGKKTECIISDNPSKGILISIGDIFKMYTEEK